MRKPGRGKTVRLTLPAAQPLESRPFEAGRASTGAEPLTVMVLDANEAVREVTCEMLGRLGYRPRPIADAAAALAECSGAEPPELLVMEPTLPGNIAAARLLAELKEQAGSLRILLTPADGAEGAGPPDDTGLAVLRKPYTEEALEAALTALMTPPLGETDERHH